MSYSEAFIRVARYVEMHAAKPLSGIDDQIHGIHMGTEWEAALFLGDLRVIVEHLRGAKYPPPSDCNGFERRAHVALNAKVDELLTAIEAAEQDVGHRPVADIIAELGPAWEVSSAALETPPTNNSSDYKADAEALRYVLAVYEHAWRTDNRVPALFAKRAAELLKGYPQNVLDAVVQQQSARGGAPDHDHGLSGAEIRSGEVPG